MTVLEFESRHPTKKINKSEKENHQIEKWRWGRLTRMMEMKSLIQMWSRCRLIRVNSPHKCCYKPSPLSRALRLNRIMTSPASLPPLPPLTPCVFKEEMKRAAALIYQLTHACREKTPHTHSPPLHPVRKTKWEIYCGGRNHWPSCWVNELLLTCAPEVAAATYHC